MSNERFEIGISPAPHEAVRLLYISRSRYGGDWHSVPHTHTCSELFYCLRGSGQFSISGELQPVVPDDLVIVNPQVEHTELSLNANPLEYIVLGVEGIEFLFDEKNERYTLISCHNQRDEILVMLKELLAEVDAHGEGSETVCRNLLEVLLIRLMRAHTLQVRSAQPTARSSRECAVVKHYLDENFAESITLDQLAKTAHVSKFYLVHAFNREYGISPINYLIRKRINEGKYLLANTDYSQVQISSQVGFSSSSYFSQSFRRLEGISPNEYRKNARRTPQK